MRTSGKTAPVFRDGAEKIIAADYSGYHGAHAIRIFNIFSDRGILGQCYCGAIWGDLSNDGAINPVDVVKIMNYVYRWLDQRVFPPNWNCPKPLGDISCDGLINPVDVMKYVNFVYRSLHQRCANPCD